MKHLLSLALVPISLGLSLVLATNVSAQTRVESPQELYTFSLYAGGFSPTAKLGAGEFGQAGTVGGTAGVLLGRYAGARINVMFTNTHVQGSPVSSFAFDDPNVWLYDADLLLRLPMETETGRFTPYLVGGVGTKLYRFDTLGDERNLAGNFGAGLEYRLPGQSYWGLSVEVRDFVSRFQRSYVDDTQNDVVWTGGLTLTF